MSNADAGRVELEYDQEVFIVVGGKDQQRKMLTEDGNLVVFESLWHAGPLTQDLQALGIGCRLVTMPLYALYCLAEGMKLGLWVLRHDGTVTSVDEIRFP
jgi:hypothetical protein